MKKIYVFPSVVREYLIITYLQFYPKLALVANFAMAFINHRATHFPLKDEWTPLSNHGVKIILSPYSWHYLIGPHFVPSSRVYPRSPTPTKYRVNKQIVLAMRRKEREDKEGKRERKNDIRIRRRDRERDTYWKEKKEMGTKIQLTKVFNMGLI